MALHFNVDDATTHRFNQLVFLMSSKLNRRVKQPELLLMAIESLERELGVEENHE